VPQLVTLPRTHVSGTHQIRWPHMMIFRTMGVGVPAAQEGRGKQGLPSGGQASPVSPAVLALSTQMTGQ
jgi:hypothetical protein